MSLTFEEYLQNLKEADLLSQEEIDAALADLSEDEKPTDGESLAATLVNKELMTAYQAQVVFRGKGHNLTLGNYIIQDKLGQGGMGMVFRAKHRNMKREVALKVVSGKMTKDKEMMQRFHREVEAAAKLNHPNIVVAHDADESQGTWYLVMEVVDGKDLSAIVKKKGPVSIAQAVDLIKQAATGLQYAHDQGVVHRDIKPSNLLLDRSGVVKILDMGLARIESEEGQAELTSTGAVMGTVDYMAPEQAVSTKHADARSDIYSLGCSLWYLLAGRAAYGGDSMMGKLLAHRDHPIPSLEGCRDDVTPELQAIFEGMVAKKPEERYQSMADVISDLEKFQSGEANLTAMQSMVRSEDSKLNNFLAGLNEDSHPLTQAADTLPEEEFPDRQSDSTRTSVSADYGTDPESMALPPRRKGGLKKRPKKTSDAWWQDRTIQMIAGGGLVLLIIVVMMLSGRGETPTVVVDENDPANDKSPSVTSPTVVQNAGKKPQSIDILHRFQAYDPESKQVKYVVPNAGSGPKAQYDIGPNYRLEYVIHRSSGSDRDVFRIPIADDRMLIFVLHQGVRAGNKEIVSGLSHPEKAIGFVDRSFANYLTGPLVSDETDERVTL